MRTLTRIQADFPRGSRILITEVTRKSEVFCDTADDERTGSENRIKKTEGRPCGYESGKMISDTERKQRTDTDGTAYCIPTILSDAGEFCEVVRKYRDIYHKIRIEEK